MNLFINDTPFFLLKDLDEADPIWQKRVYRGDEIYELKGLSGTVVITDVSTEQALRYLKELVKNHYEDVSFRILPDYYDETKKLLKKQFKIIDAAGGVVRNPDRDVLLIYRLKKWDLPKGKLEKGEKFKVTAVREVEEETRVKVILGKKITTTWHTYAIRNKPILKRTKWYIMEGVDDSAMKPQKSEHIEKLAWMDTDEVTKRLRKSYRSIRFVMQSYWSMLKDID